MMTEILPGGTEAVVGDTEEQIEAYTEDPIDGDARALVDGNIRAEGSNEPIDGNHGLTEIYRELLAGA